MNQSSLFPPCLPDGLAYKADFITQSDEQALIRNIAALPLTEARYKEYTARRRTMSFGSSFDYDRNISLPAPPMPEFLQGLRAQVAAWAQLPEATFVHTLIAEYRPGTPLGWHRDVPEFEIIAGVSLAGPAVLRFRPYPWSSERKRDMFAIELEPRSVYVLRDTMRWGWQHSVPAVDALRYSITFRTRRDASRHRSDDA